LKDPKNITRSRLLIAEDDPMLRQIMGIILRRDNYDIDFAENGQVAVEMWEKGGYDLILMDVQMPWLNGLNATAAIREKEHSHGGHTPIIAMTAHSLQEDRQRCLAAGMDACLSKPLDLKESRQVIQEMLYQAKVEEEIG